MRLAVIHQGSSLGAYRYFYMLVKHLKKVAKDIDITVFEHNLNYNEGIFNCKQDLENIDIKFQNFIETTSKYKYKKRFPVKFISNIMNYPYKYKFNYLKKIKKYALETMLKDFDCILYTWPYGVEVVNTGKPTYFVSHDFIISHYFGSYFGNNVYNKEQWLNCKKTFDKLLEFAEPIVSNHYIADDMKQIFKEKVKNINIVYLSKFNDYPHLTSDEISAVKEKYDIHNDYILCANNAQLHKNLGQALSGYYYVKQKYPNIKFIITGYLTDGIRLTCNTPYYCDQANGSTDYDIKSLGEIPEEDFAAILQGAKILINPSLCEAGCGSGLDAWNCKIPVAMSDIPAFTNQMNYLGVKAELFNPRNSEDIGRALIKLLDNPELAKANAETSKTALDNYTWDNVAEQYLSILKGE